MASPAEVPNWRQTPDGWIADDPTEQTFAIAAMLCGFNLPTFDNWLRDLGPCPARDELLERRARAKAAPGAAMKAALEWLHLRRFTIERDATLLPLARRGAKFSPGKPKGAAGPVRALVRDMLKRKACATLTARQLWEACAALPERRRRGIDFESNDNAFVAGHGNVSFRRFANIVTEERKPQ